MIVWINGASLVWAGQRLTCEVGSMLPGLSWL